MKKVIQGKSGKRLDQIAVLIRGAGEMASGVAHRLHQSHFKVCMLEISHPIAVRREVSFCEAVYEGEKEVEGVRSKLISGPKEIQSLWEEGNIPILVDPDGKKTRQFLKPDVLIDAILAKRNLGTRIHSAPLVIGLGPGFNAGKDVHIVIETNHDFPVIARINGVVRGLVREGVEVKKGMKVGDIDPRGKREFCFTVSDKARSISGGVLEAILYHFNK